MVLMLGQLVEYYIEEILEEKFDCPKTNFGLLNWQGDSLAYSLHLSYMIQWSPRLLDWGWVPKPGQAHN